MEHHEVEAELLQYLSSQCDCDVDADSDLLESGYVDSLLVMDLVLHIKSRFQVALSAADLAPRHFRSVGRLTELVISRATNLPGPSMN